MHATLARTVTVPLRDRLFRRNVREARASRCVLLPSAPAISVTLGITRSARSRRWHCAAQGDLQVTQVHPRNSKVLGYFSRSAEEPKCVGPWEVGPDPYMASGSHPDVVSRVWDEIGSSLPEDCKCRVGYSPALVHPRTGLLLAVAMGTQYALRLPSDLRQTALNAGLKTSTVWGLKHHFDLSASLGSEWVFGGWLKEEFEWLRLAYEAESAA